MNFNHILLTGGAGFIGSHVADKLLQLGKKVTVIDNYDPFYDKRLKENNIRRHEGNPSFRFIECDLTDAELEKLVDDRSIDLIIHLAAKAGVRPSLANPVKYHEVNINGTLNLLEFARARGIEDFIFASSSSVYGINSNVPWKESDADLLPISPYASTKLSCELLGHVYSRLYDIRFIGLRFFTVYGPRQRPDLAIHKFTKMLYQGAPIPMYGDGKTYRDYTYVDDIVSGILNACNYTDDKYAIFNIGNDQTVSLIELIQTLEEVTGKKAIIDQQPFQPGDVPKTWADITKAREKLHYNPTTSIRDGIEKFVKWYETNQLIPSDSD